MKKISSYALSLPYLQKNWNYDFVSHSRIRALGIVNVSFAAWVGFKKSGNLDFLPRY